MKIYQSRQDAAPTASVIIDDNWCGFQSLPLVFFIWAGLKKVGAASSRDEDRFEKAQS